MNADRRKQIQRAIELLEEAKGILETARDDEQDYFDNMPESFQQGEKGQRAEEVIGNLEEANDALDEVIANSLTASE